VVNAHAELEVYFDAEAKISEEEIAEREHRWGESERPRSYREERW
jgi:hypothetical protein